MNHPSNESVQPQLQESRGRQTGRRGVCAVAAVLALHAVSWSAVAHAGDLDLTVTNITSAQGVIQLAVYASENDFRKNPVRSLRQEISATGQIRVVIANLPAGDYAVMAYHDLNGNDDLDTNLLGIPSEPWGASLGDKTVFGAPAWADVRFPVPATGMSATIDLK